MTAVTREILTAEEFRLMPAHPRGFKQELVAGEVVTESHPGFRHGKRQLRIGRKLDEFVEPRKLGHVAVETGVVTERDPDTVRGPDDAFWSAERRPIDQEPEGYPDVAPDLCVEIVSPSNRPGTTRRKVEEYFVRGVRMVWIVDPEDQSVRIFRAADEGRILYDNATLSGEDVIP